MWHIDLESRGNEGNTNGLDALREPVENELDKILSSASFDASDRNRNFLRYVVTETLAGRADRIKGYNIALAVFDRDASFDPQIDPVVRIEAGRLRRSLERYYLTDGRNNDFCIAINKGSYVPHFERQNGSRSKVSDRHRPALLVTPFTDLSDDRHFSCFARGLTDDIIAELSQHSKLRIFVVPDAPGRNTPEIYSSLPVGLLLSGSIRQSKGAVRVIAHLIDQVDFRCVWSEAFDRDTSHETALVLEREVGRKIAASIVRWEAKNGVVGIITPR